MKVKALLSLLAAGAIVTTAGVSYAAWDQLSESKSATAGSQITIADRTVVTLNTDTLSWTGTLAPTDAEALKYGASDSLNSTFTVAITNTDNLSALKLSATNVKVDNATAPEGLVKIAFSEDKEGADDPIPESGDTTLSATNTYKVTVSLDAAVAEANPSVATKNITFDITAAATGKTV